MTVLVEARKVGREVAEGLPRPRSVQIMRIAFLTATLVFVLFPLVWLALGSLKTRHDALSLPPRIIFEPTFEAYAKIVAGGFMRAFGNSLVIALTNVALALLIGTPAAFALTRMRGRIRDDLSFWVLSIRMAPVFAVILPLYVLFKGVGLLDTPLCRGARPSDADPAARGMDADDLFPQPAGRGRPGGDARRRLAACRSSSTSSSR